MRVILGMATGPTGWLLGICRRGRGNRCAGVRKAIGALCVAVSSVPLIASAEPRVYTFAMEDVGPYVYSGSTFLNVALASTIGIPAAMGWSGSFVAEDTNSNGRIEQAELLGYQDTITRVGAIRVNSFDSEVLTASLAEVVGFSYDLDGDIGRESAIDTLNVDYQVGGNLRLNSCYPVTGVFPYSCDPHRFFGRFVEGVSPIVVTQGEIIAGPTAGFTAFSTTLAGVPAAVTFTNTSTMDPRVTAPSYAWDFGNGDTSTEASPSYSYTTPGRFDASLTICTGSLCDTTTQQITVTDGTPAELVITGVPDGFTGPTSATVTFNWGEDVVGFEDADITVTGGTLGPIVGGPQVWTAELAVEGTSNVTVSIAAGAVQDATGTPSAAASVTGRFASSALAEQVVRQFIAARASSLIAAQPSLPGLLGGDDPSGAVEVSRGQGMVQFHSGAAGSVWTALDANWSDTDGFETAYTLLSFGTHMRLGNESLLGVMLQLDRAASRQGTSRIEGTGWLIGPYYVARHGGLSVDARLLWGETENEISPIGTYTDTFSTERMLAMVNVSGEIEAGAVTLRPLLGWTHVDDRSEAYIDALSNPVASQHVRFSEVKAALDWSRPLGRGDVEFTGGFAGIFASQTGGTGFGTGNRGRLDLGLRRQGAGALSFDIGLFADGLFQPGVERYGLDASVEWRF